MGLQQQHQPQPTVSVVSVSYIIMLISFTLRLDEKEEKLYTLYQKVIGVIPELEELAHWTIENHPEGLLKVGTFVSPHIFCNFCLAYTS